MARDSAFLTAAWTSAEGITGPDTARAGGVPTTSPTGAAPPTSASSGTDNPSSSRRVGDKLTTESRSLSASEIVNLGGGHDIIHVLNKSVTTARFECRDGHHAGSLTSCRKSVACSIRANQERITRPGASMETDTHCRARRSLKDFNHCKVKASSAQAFQRI
ncbi:hypothetical protein Vretifemale_16184, partial [Volvox reticuliferus]